MVLREPGHHEHLPARVSARIWTPTLGVSCMHEPHGHQQSQDAVLSDHPTH